jgi:DNA-binding LacI/PurR family transcriptional regulator
MSRGTIGVITNNQHPVFQRLNLTGIREAASAHGYDVVVDSYAESPTSAGHITLDPASVNGILVIANAAPTEYLKLVYQMGIPVSLISHYEPELPVPVVLSNNSQGMAELVRHIVTRCGRRNLVFVRGIAEQIDAKQREQAFRNELMRYDLAIPEHYFIRGEFVPQIAVESMGALIRRGNPFDAVIAADYLMAIAIVDMLRAEGIRVPEQVCVAGFGDDVEAERAGLTTVGANIRQLARHAFNQLVSQIEGLRIRGVTRLSVELVIRETCGCS